MKYFLISLTGLIFWSLPQAAFADKLVEGAKLCTAYIPTMERQYGVPSHLLSAISSTETGRYNKKLKILLPWPWTINVEGKGYYFDTKAEAVAAVKQHQQAGRRSIDIGCMQVNMIYHGHAFSSIEQAFDPKQNIQYAASFLRRLYEDEKSWRKAAAAYHSKTPTLGSKYVGRVFRAWETIVSRLRLPGRETLQMADARFDGKTLIAGSEKGKAVTLTRTTNASPSLASHEPLKMKVIKVNNAPSAATSNIVMIRPDVSAASASNAYKPKQNIVRVDTGDSPTLAQTSPDMNIIRLGKQNQDAGVTIASAESISTKSSGPRFIFSE